MESVRRKIANRLDDLERLMGEQKHLTHSEHVEHVIDSVSKFWSVLNEEEKEYLQAARYALDKKAEWKYD